MEGNEDDLSTQERLDAILIRVRSGQPLVEALNEANEFYWFYSKLTRQQRLPIIQARRAIQAAQRENEKRSTQSAHAKNGFVVIWVSLPPDRRDAFQALCDQKSTVMTHRINKLINADIKQFLESQGQQSG